MSQNVEPIQTVLIKDPRTTMGRKKYAIFRGPQNNTFQPVTTTNIAVNQVVFNIKPRMKDIVSSTLKAQFPIRLALYTNAPNANPILRSGYDAPRNRPLQSMTQNISCNFGGAVVTGQPAEYIHAMSHVGFGEKMLEEDLSGTPTYLDASQSYDNLIGSIKNPLGSYGDCNEFSLMPRGGFPFVVVANDVNHCVIDMLVTEDIMLSPWNVSKDLHPGFVGLQSIDVTFQFIASNPAYRAWSHSTAGVNAPGPITSSALAFNNFDTIDPNPFSFSAIQAPQLLMQFLTPTLTDEIPLLNMYPLYQVQPYITQYGANVGANSSTGMIQINNVVFGRIPNRVLIFGREQNSQLYSSPSKTDTFFAIEKININFANRDGQLSAATQYDLWKTAVENGCTQSFTEWQGVVYQPGNLTTKIGAMGSVLPLVFGKDIVTDPGYAPGVGGQYNFQFQISFKNLDQVNAKSLAIYVIAISEGVMNISNGIALQNFDVISNLDVLTAATDVSPYVNYNEIKDVSGGNIWTGIKSFAKDVWSDIRTAIRKANEIYKKVKPYIGPIVDVGKTVLPLLAAGELEDEEGGCDDCGGAEYSRAEMIKRLKKKDTTKKNSRSRKYT
jgi:hypothetical protein